MAVALALSAGCRAPAPEPYATWIEKTPPYRPGPGGGNAFDAYVLAAEQAESANPAWLKRVWFTPGMRRQVQAKLARTIARVETATRSNCRFEFRPTAMGQTAPYRAGWRLLGRALVWRVEEAAALHEHDQAVRRFLVATKFGFDLCGGAAEDVSLGMAVVDEARQALLPSLPALSARQLDQLASSLARLERTRPAPADAIRHEGLNMLASVEAIQAAYRARDFRDLRRQLGPSAESAIRALERLPEGEARADYFAGFAAEARREVEAVLALAEAPASQRTEPDDPPGPRPWAKLARHVCGGARPMLAIVDRTVARTRLLAIHAWATARLRQTGQAPRSLPAFASAMNDPYTGRPLAFRSTGSEFAAYSTGPDARDDGGESDASGLAPDLTLEPVD